MPRYTCEKFDEMAITRAAMSVLHMLGSEPMTPNDPSIKEIRDHLRQGCEKCNIFSGNAFFAVAKALKDRGHKTKSLQD